MSKEMNLAKGGWIKVDRTNKFVHIETKSEKDQSDEVLKVFGSKVILLTPEEAKLAAQEIFDQSLMLDRPTEVPIREGDMFWKVYAKHDAEAQERHPAKHPIIELSWGWTAGMSPENISEMADDCPTGQYAVSTTLDFAKELRDNLDEIIKTLEE